MLNQWRAIDSFFCFTLCLSCCAQSIDGWNEDVCVGVCVCCWQGRYLTHSYGVFPTPRARVYVCVAFVSVCMCACAPGMLGNLMTDVFLKQLFRRLLKQIFFVKLLGFLPVPIHTCPVSFSSCLFLSVTRSESVSSASTNHIQCRSFFRIWPSACQALHGTLTSTW